MKEKTAEQVRLEEDAGRSRNWKRWGPYLAERQWGTVREDYSAGGASWDYLTHDQARSRAYRWGEDGLLGITDRQARLCFALALWNGKDPILKERLFGLAGPEGNHGEDVKECYYYLDSTPTHSYMRALYRYPQGEFPYAALQAENRSRSKEDPEFELLDTDLFRRGRYFDVYAEYAKAAPDDILIRLSVANRGSEQAEIHVIPTLWYRNTWSWGRTGEGYWAKPSISLRDEGLLVTDHESLGRFLLAAGPSPGGGTPEFLFTENETNLERLFGVPNPQPYVKDAFHRFVIQGKEEAVNPERLGSKAGVHYTETVPAGGTAVFRLRLYAEQGTPSRRSGTASTQAAGQTHGLAAGRALGRGFEAVFRSRRDEAAAFYASVAPPGLTAEEEQVLRQGYAGLLWTKQFYHYSLREWLEGDPAQPAPPEGRRGGRNHDWVHLYNRDVISMPDKWEYPWYAAWDLAFHVIALAGIDPKFAKEQIILLLREWYMHPNGQLPAYEWALSDVNPPVHAWAAWRVYKMTGPRGGRDRAFLARVFQKLLLNFTWWVNRKDPHGQNVFAGGFLGLDNIGVFDRSQPLPTGGHLEQADGTAWMAFYCSTMLAIALELAAEDPAYEDMASKFFEHFMAVVGAINSLDGCGLWDEEDGFYFDHLHVDDRFTPLRVRSLVGLLPLIAVEILEDEVVDRLPGFKKRMDWYLRNRPDLTDSMSCMVCPEGARAHGHRILAVTTRERLQRVLRYLLDEGEFLSPYGIRSLSRVHRERPYVFRADGREYRVEYSPGESTTGLFGGNSNWRGPVWFPLNFLIIEALERYHHFYGESLQVEFPAGSGRFANLGSVAGELAGRLCRIFLPDGRGHRPCHGGEALYAQDPAWKDLVLFYEYFHGDTGRGLGASHQTGWTALVLKLMEDLARRR